MGTKKYRCFYCWKAFPDTRLNRLRHRQGAGCGQLRTEYYRQFEDPRIGELRRQLEKEVCKIGFL